MVNKHIIVITYVVSVFTITFKCCCLIYMHAYNQALYMKLCLPYELLLLLSRIQNYGNLYATNNAALV